MTEGGRWVLVRCGACGTEFVATDGSLPPTPHPPTDEVEAPTEPREYIFLDEAGVLVSDVRFVSPDCAFAMGDVVRCEVRGVPGRWRWPWPAVLLLLAAFGLVGAAGAAAALAFAPGVPWFVRGLGLAVGGMLLAVGGPVLREARRHRYRRLERFRLVVGVGGFVVEAFSDADEELVSRIAAAVRDALRAERSSE